MKALEIIRNLYEYNIWANAEFMRYFERAKQLDEKAVRVFAHLLLAEKTWLERITGENPDDTGTNFWVGETLAECVLLFEENQHNFAEFFDGMTEEKLVSSFDYKNSKGTAFRNIALETLTHVFLHSGYHRGQAAQAIRLNGETPPSTDFIQFLR